MITLQLNADVVQAIINLMGETQAKQGFYPLMVDIAKQLEVQIKEQPPTE
jgi:hypothetical protein